MPSPPFLPSSHSLPRTDRTPSATSSQHSAASDQHHHQHDHHHDHHHHQTDHEAHTTPQPTSRRPTPWSRFLHLFHPSRRRRTSPNPAPNAPISSRIVHGMHVPQPQSHGTRAPPNEPRRTRRPYRLRNVQHNRRQRNRRTMSDGALQTSSETSSTSLTPPTLPAQPTSMSARNARSPFLHHSMRFRRPPVPTDAASSTSLGGVGSTGSMLSDSDESAHDDLHAVVSGGERDARSSTLMPSALADFDAIHDHDLFAMVNRLWEDYAGPPNDVFQSSVYVRRMPVHARQRLAMRVQNAYYIGRRHGRSYNGHGDVAVRIGMPGVSGMHHHHHHHHHHHGHGATLHGQGNLPGGMHVAFGLEDREVRLNLHAVRIQEGAHGPCESSASDAQIEALPSFVMEKGETRSVQEIFESLRNGAEHESKKEDGDLRRKKTFRKEEDGNDSDECGGLMTSFTECAICLCDFEPGDEITVLPCGHFFHLTGCVREWLSKHARTCPTCRADICADNSQENPNCSSSNSGSTGQGHGDGHGQAHGNGHGNGNANGNGNFRRTSLRRMTNQSINASSATTTATTTAAATATATASSEGVG